jgi:hypothetical protein
MSTIRDFLAKEELAIGAAGTSEGASKGWDARGRGRAMVKTLGLPGGANAKVNSEGYTFMKKGGYFNKMNDIHDKAQANGFVRDMGKSGATGSQAEHMGQQNIFRHPDGWELQTAQSYGATKDSNWHHITLKNSKQSDGSEGYAPYYHGRDTGRNPFSKDKK